MGKQKATTKSDNTDSDPAPEEKPPRQNGVRPSRVHLPVVEPARSVPRVQAGGETRLRFRLASFLRVTDNLVARAVNAYDRIFSLDTAERADIYLQMGVELGREGRIEDALEALRKAADIEPDNGAIVVELAVSHLRRGAPEAAVRGFRKALELGESSYRLHRTFAEALIEQDRLDEALDQLERARELKPDSDEAAYKLGTLLDKMGRAAQAVEAFKHAVAIAPEEIAYHQSLGFALESAGKRKQAVKCFKRALDLEHAEGMTLEELSAE